MKLARYLLVGALLARALCAADAVLNAAAIKAIHDRLLEGVDRTDRLAALTALEVNYNATKSSEESKLRTFAEHKRALEYLDSGYDEAKGTLLRLDRHARASELLPPFIHFPVNAWRIRRSSEPDSFEKAALASYENDGETEKYSLQAALIVHIPGGDLGPWRYRSEFGNDVDVTSQKAKNPGNVTTRLSTIFHRMRSPDAPGMFRSVLIIPTFAHVANRNLASLGLVGGMWAQPELIAGPLLLNRVGDSPLGRYSLGPVLGAEWGSVTKRPAKPQPESGGFTRVAGRLHFRFFPKIAKSWSIYATETVRWLADDNLRAYYHFNVGLEYSIGSQWTLTFDHSIGRDQPTFSMTAATDKIGLGYKY